MDSTKESYRYTLESIFGVGGKISEVNDFRGKYQLMGLKFDLDLARSKRLGPDVKECLIMCRGGTQMKITSNCTSHACHKHTFARNDRNLSD